MTIETLLSRVSFDRDPISDTKIGETVYYSEDTHLQKLDISQGAWNIPNLEHFKETVKNELRDATSSANIRQIALTHATLWYQELQLVHGKTEEQAQETTRKEIERVALLAQEVPEFKNFSDVLYDSMEFYRQKEGLTTIPGLTSENGVQATREEFGTDLLYVLLMDLRFRTGNGDIIGLNHDAVKALSTDDIEEAKQRVVSMLEHADEKTQQASFSIQNVHKTILVTPDDEDNAYLIMSRAAAKAYHGGPDTLLQNTRAMFWFIANHYVGEQVPELTTVPLKEEVPFATQHEVPKWIKRIAKLAVLGSGYYLWQQARDLNNRIMGNNHEGCVVAGMVRIEKVTFNIGTFLTAWQHVSNALARIDAARTYEEFGKSSAFFPGAALLTAIGETIASKVEI